MIASTGLRVRWTVRRKLPRRGSQINLAWLEIWRNRAAISPPAGGSAVLGSSRLRRASAAGRPIAAYQHVKERPPKRPAVGHVGVMFGPCLPSVGVAQDPPRGGHGDTSPRRWPPPPESRPEASGRDRPAGLSGTKRGTVMLVSLRYHSGITSVSLWYHFGIMLPVGGRDTAPPGGGRGGYGMLDGGCGRSADGSGGSAHSEGAVRGRLF